MRNNIYYIYNSVVGSKMFDNKNNKYEINYHKKSKYGMEIFESKNL